MKKIEALIRPECLFRVRNALERVGYPGLTISEVEGHGRQRGTVQTWQGEDYKVDYVPKIKLEMVCPDQDLESMVETILEFAHTGEPGDGKIFISEVEEVIRVRTRERGTKALTV